jgi:molybdate transport system regulatory protein
MQTLRYETKLWIVNQQGEAVFGSGLAELIEEIDAHHSVLEAAKHMGMSYRYALHRLTTSEERLGQSLVTRQRGGSKGGGSSEVTEFGKRMVKRFRHAQQQLHATVEKMP